MRRHRLLWALIVAGAMLSGGCGDEPQESVSFFDTLGAIAIHTDTANLDDKAYVVDRGSSELIELVAGAKAQTRTPLTAPDGGWGARPMRAWRSAATEVVVDVLETGGAHQYSRIDLASGVQSPWRNVTAAVHWRVWEGRLVAVTGAAFGAATDVTATIAPASAAAVPRMLAGSGYPLWLTRGTMAWWDPVSAQINWEVALGVTGTVVAFTKEIAAWTGYGMLFTAPVSAVTVGTIWRAPLESAVLELRHDPFDPTAVWVAGADGSLNRWSGGPEEGVLCAADWDGSGSKVAAITFSDRGSLSDPTLEVLRVGRSKCPGWTRDDQWYLTYQEVPTVWQDVSVRPGSTISELPHGELLRIGDRLRADGSEYSVATTTPLMFNPTLSGPITGDILPMGRWTVRTGRQGFVSIVAPEEVYNSPGLSFVIRSGNDPVDTADRFSFRTENGVTPLSVPGKVEAWTFLDSGELLAADPKGNTVIGANYDDRTQTGQLQ